MVRAPAHLFAFALDRLGFLTRMVRRHGDAVWLRLGGPVLLINDPADIRHVLTVSARNYEKGPRMVSESGRRLLGEGVLTSKGEEHLGYRRAMLPLLQGQAASESYGAIAAAIKRRLEVWRGCRTLDATVEMETLARDAIVGVAFGTGFEDADGRVAWAIRARRRFIGHAFLANPMTKLFDRRLRAEHERALAILHAKIDRRAAEARRGGKGCGMIGDLAGRDDGEGGRIDDSLLRDEIVTLLVTGHETIADGLAWCWYLLARNPEVRDRLEAELERVLGGSFPAPEHLGALEYTWRIAQESMRLYPPTWIFVRQAKQADLLPSGAEVPGGARLYLCPWVTHRDRRYFPEPERFDPDRFAVEAERLQPRIAYFPFGAGTHRCIGEDLARREMTLVLAAVAQRYRLEVEAGHRAVPAPRITLSPRGGLPVRLLLR